MDNEAYFAPAAKGLESLLKDELIALGCTRVIQVRAGCAFEATRETAYRVCLWSRLASRVFYTLTTGAVSDKTSLYALAHAVPFEEHFTVDTTFRVDATLSSASSFTHSNFASLTVKDAIVDRFRERYDKRPSVDTDAPGIRVNVNVRREKATLYIDLSGTPLHQRGYRTERTEAPLRETLAAALLTATGWKEIAKNKGAFVDPMCGSGTLAIEAALIAGDIAPQRSRTTWGWDAWLPHDPLLWETLIAEAREREAVGAKNMPPIFGSDISRDAIAKAKANAANMGLYRAIRFTCHDVRESIPLPRNAPSGLCLTNPPYGERMKENALPSLYRALAMSIRCACAGWDVGIFSSDTALIRATGLIPAHTHTFFNGAIETTLYAYTIAKKGEDALSSGARMFANRLTKNRKHVGKRAKREGVTCFRLYDKDMPEYAFALDVYETEQKETYLHLQEYRAPKGVDEKAAEARRFEAYAALTHVFDLPIDRVIFKERAKQKGDAQYEKRDERRSYVTVREGGHRFLVNFWDYLDTGLFLDHRLTRKMVEEKAKGTRFLNLFSYTATATVYAMKGGARETTSVDLSKTYTAWAEWNLRANDITGGAHRVIARDVFAYLDEAKEKRALYDLVFCDPPTFSNSKKTDDSFDVNRDHVRLLTRVGAVLAKGGSIIFSNNSRSFKLNRDALALYDVEEVTKETIPFDYERNPRIHTVWILRKRT